MSDADQVAILGTGAVGVFLAAHLDAATGETIMVARGGERRQSDWQLVDARTQATRIVRATVLPAREGPLPVAHLLICVRGEQIDEAIATATALAPTAAFAIAAPLAPAQLQAVRASHPGRVFYTLVPMFNTWSAGERRYCWLQPPLVKTLLSGEHDPAASAAAEAMGSKLARGGLPVRVVPSAMQTTATFFAAGLPVLASWELSGWSRRVVDGAALRRTTARAMREALLVARDARGLAATLLRHVPSALVAAVLAAARWFVTAPLLAMWQHHGPKIAVQTRDMLDALLARGAREHVATPHLRALRDRLAANENQGGTHDRAVPER